MQPAQDGGGVVLAARLVEGVAGALQHRPEVGVEVQHLVERRAHAVAEPLLRPAERHQQEPLRPALRPDLRPQVGRLAVGVG